MSKHRIFTLDLNFMGNSGAIASYLIPHSAGAVLVECGPGSTLPALMEGLRQHGFSPSDISDVFLTHIHLDHAGAAGWLARQGARIHVHPVGAPHMQNPEKLLSSAARIYGDSMDTLWGEFLPVPPEQISVLQDNDVITVDGMSFKAIDTPGHADHHHVYLLGDTLFSGDIGGVRLTGTHHIRLPMPPPEFNTSKWEISLQRLSHLEFSRIAPTHFGIFEDAKWHLSALEKGLNDINAWIEAIMPGDPPVDEINRQLNHWYQQRADQDGVPREQLQGYESANPSWMSGYGIQRYWRKVRLAETSQVKEQ
jgi:glyoxylase-like metal-dependent hydrolase (beta-lactamase superfamily II)